jgi:hypothetical protein
MKPTSEENLTQHYLLVRSEEITCLLVDVVSGAYSHIKDRDHENMLKALFKHLEFQGEIREEFFRLNDQLEQAAE